MCCLEGALAYFMNCRLGYMKVNELYRVGSLPYEIMAYTHEISSVKEIQFPSVVFKVKEGFFPFVEPAGFVPA